MRKYLQILFFLILIFFKVSAAHVYLHNHDDSNIDNCELCEHAVYNQTIEFSTPPSFDKDFEIDRIPAIYHQESHYENIYITVFINDIYFGRPPPSLI